MGNRRIWLIFLCLGAFLACPQEQIVAQCTVNLGNDTLVCSSDTVILDISSQFNFHEDSLVIVYDATQGTSGLAGDSVVYMHSAAEIVPFGGWQYTTGNWGMHDGIGQMTSLGSNLWTITIHPKTYYNYPGTAINGIFMVFRNFDGSKTGKDGSNQDIWVNMATNPPSSSFGGVALSWRVDEVQSVLWSDSTTGTNMVAPGTGTFWVEVTDTAGCVARDSINILLSSNPPDLGPDTVSCAGAVNIVLDAGAGYTSYSWSGGGSNQTKTITTAGTYYVDVIDTAGCSSSDTIEVAVSTPPAVNLGPDTGFCQGNLTLNAGSGFNSYTWSTGANTNSILVSTGGLYWVEVSDSAGCLGRDSINIVQTQAPTPNLGPNQSICQGDSVLLDAGSGYSAYSWSTGASGQIIYATNAGNYTVTVTDSAGCQGSDILNLSLDSLPVAAFNPNTSNGLTVTFIDQSNNGNKYYWDFTGNGQIDDSTAGSPNYTYPVPGTFTVTLIVTNDCGSDTSTQTIVVSQTSILEDENLIIQIYPVPAKDYLYISTEHLGLYRFEIVDMLGRTFQPMISKEGNFLWKVHLGEIPEGLYNLNVELNNNATIGRYFFKQ